MFLRRSRRPLGARPTFYLFEAGFTGLHALAFTLMIVYQLEVVGLNPLQLILVGTAMELACFFGEIPTGVIADRYSRRLSILIGLLVIGGAIMLQGAVAQFWAVLVGQAVWGIGWTFISGAHQAWVTDEVGVDAVQAVLTRGQQVGLVSTLIGTALAGALGLLALQLPIVIAGVGFVILATILALIMPEQGFRPDPGASATAGWASLITTFKAGIGQVKRRPVVRWFFVTSLLFGLSSEAIDRLWVARVLQDFTLPTVAGRSDPALWFAGFAMISVVLSLVASMIINRVVPGLADGAQPGRMLALLAVLQSVAVIVLALSGQLWLAVGAVWLRGMASTIAQPVMSAWINRQLESSSRATVLSMNGQADAIGQIAGGPPFGALATATSIRVALIGSALLIMPAAVIYQWLARRSDRDRP